MNKKYSQKDFYLLIKKNLRRIHEESGYSRAHVAEQINITFQAHSDMLTLSLLDRYPSIETIRKLCNFFEIQPSEFFQATAEENQLQKS